MPYVGPMEPAQSQYAYPRRAPARTRAGLVVLAVLITEIVLIGGGANQWVTERIVRRAADASQTVRLIDGSWLVYEWRFTPQHGENAIWGSQLLLILTVLVLSALLVWVVVRGPVSFARAFFGTWMAVIVASLLGAFVRGLVYPHTEVLLPGVNRVVRAVYSSAGPSNVVVAGSFALGLVVGLVAGLIAATTGRRPAPAQAPGGPPEFADYGPPPATEPPAYLPPWQDSHYGPPPAYQPGGEQTTRLPREWGDETTQLPREPQSAWPPPSPGAPFQSPPREPEPTQAHPPVADEEPQDATQAYPAVGAEPAGAEPAGEQHQETARLPQAESGPEPGSEAGPPPAAGPPPQAGQAAAGQPAREQDEPTTRFPRPPDDDELGHVDH